MSQPTPSVSPELKVLMRRLKLGQLLATLPERLALARSHELTHIEFLEQLFSDEVLVALLPGRVAARTRTSLLLRAE
jgi:hypothetical protein